MPGRLMAEHDPDRVNGAIAGRKKPVADLNLPNGVLSNHGESSQLEKEAVLHAAPMTNGTAPSTVDNSGAMFKSERPLHELPPEIAQITANFQPLSKLLGRAAQECYNSLTNVITTLGESREQAQVNGDAITAVNGLTTAASAHKRVQWLNFANTNRERFIKLLVLLQWSRQVEEVSKIIDLFAWMREQENHYNNVDDMMGYLKRDMHPEKIPSPDLDTALEILSTGQSSQMPDLQYLPRAPLSAPDLLKMLKTINTLLHIRLNLHETLPRHFRTFSIASGRATFSVPTEFEIDLSIAEDDPNSCFYFIDFRFLFTPVSEIPAGPLRSELEARANEVLASSGLSGCYDFFHDFVLTHKLNVLRLQAIGLNRATWAGSLRVEQLHRSVVIQYWVDRPGPKCWIEIGVNSGKRERSNGSRKGDEQSYLAVKWLHGNRDAEAEALSQINLADLDIERLLQDIITKHIDLILSAVGHSLEAVGCSVIYKAHTAVDQSSLELPLSFSGSSTLNIEPTTGHMALIPTTAISVRYETTLNTLKNPAEQAEASLVSFKVSETSATIRQAAARFNWESVSDIDPKVARVFGIDKTHPASRANLFKPWKNSNWIVASLVTPVEEPTWWIARFIPSGAGKASVDDFQNLESLPAVTSNDGILGQAFFSRLETLAILKISSDANTTQLKQLAVLHSLSSDSSFHQISSNTAPEILLQVSTLLRARNSRSSFVADQVIVEMPVSSSLVEGQPTVAYVVKGTMIASTEFLRLLTKWREPDMVIDKHGAFALRIQSTLDTPSVIDFVMGRLSSLCRLKRCLEILESRNFKCTAATFGKVSFDYASVEPSSSEQNTSDPTKAKRNSFADDKNTAASPEDTKSESNSLFSDSEVLSAEVDFTHGRVAANFFPTATNPLNHLRPLFTRLLNRGADHTDAEALSAFADFTRALQVVLPLTRAISSIAGQATFHMRTLRSCRLAYSRPRCAFTIRYQLGRDNGQDGARSAWMWFIEPIAPRPSDIPNAKLQEALADFWKDQNMSSAGNVVKLSNGVACTFDTLEKTIKELGNVVNSCRDTEPEDTDLLEEGAEDQQGDAKKPAQTVTAEENPTSITGLGLELEPNTAHQPMPTTPLPTSIVQEAAPGPAQAPTTAPVATTVTATAQAPAQATAPPTKAATGSTAQVRQQHANGPTTATANLNGNANTNAKTAQAPAKPKDKEKGKPKANANSNANSNSNGREVIMLDD